ncbi:hypothetical protein ACSPAH_17600 [Buttiauxella agrestis]
MTKWKGAIVWVNAKSEKKAKKTCASAQVGAKNLLNNVTRILTNQYLWDLNCGAVSARLPVRKSKGISGKCNQLFKTSRLVTGCHFLDKKNLRIRAGWCNSCDQH